MEGSNPEPTPIQESSGSSSMRSSKIRPCYVEYNYGASSSAANNPFVRKKIKMSFNEMMFMSQESTLF